MIEIDHDAERFRTACWALWPSKAPGARSILIAVYASFQAMRFSFYPETEWVKFGHRPPETRRVLGAWRNDRGTAAAFLLDTMASTDNKTREQVLLYTSGDDKAITIIGSKIAELKNDIEKIETRHLLSQDSDRQLDEDQIRKPITRLAKLVGFFTVVVNGFSFYLRKIPAPQFSKIWIANAYEIVVASIHIAALLFILSITLVGIGYVFRYARLLSKRH
jgi:hypothetical protein